MGSDAAIRVKSRKPAAENLMNLESSFFAKIVSGADNVICDQMREMTRDREHQIMVLRGHSLGHRSHADQKALSFSTALSSARSGVKMHQRFWNSVAKPASGPEHSVPAIGCAGTKWTPSGRCGATCSMTAFFTEPTSVSITPD